MYDYKGFAGRSGTTVIIFSCSLVFILMICAFVVDLGYVILQKYKLSITADAATLAGAQDLINGAQKASLIAKSYITKNDNEIEKIDISILEDSTAITVKLYKTIDYFFMKTIGYKSVDIKAESTAVISSVSAYKGARPFAVQQQDFSFGQEYVLKDGAGDSASGNYGAVAFLEPGAVSYKYNIMYGYQSILNVNDCIYTEPGNMVSATNTAIEYLISGCSHTPSCTYQNYVKGCTKTIIIPVVDTIDLSGRKPCKVVGFATFFLEGCINSGGHTEIIGYFVKSAIDADTSDEVGNYGTVGIRLVR